MPLPEQGEFVQTVLDTLGLTQTQLGVEMRKPNAYQTVHAWLTGTKKLGYQDTLWLLDRCGWLNLGGAATAAQIEQERVKLLAEAQELLELATARLRELSE